MTTEHTPTPQFTCNRVGLRVWTITDGNGMVFGEFNHEQDQHNCVVIENIVRTMAAAPDVVPALVKALKTLRPEIARAARHAPNTLLRDRYKNDLAAIDAALRLAKGE